MVHKGILIMIISFITDDEREKEFAKGCSAPECGRQRYQQGYEAKNHSNAIQNDPWQHIVWFVLRRNNKKKI